MKITDEILNKYIDGELSEQEQKEFSAALLSDPEMQKQLKELQRVHTVLPGIETIKAPDNITAIVMSRIMNKSTLLVKDKKFFRFMCAIFALLSASMIYWGFSSAAPDDAYTSIFDRAGESMALLIPDISISVNTEYFILGSLFLIVILLISMMYLWETHRNFNRQIDKF